MIICYIILIHSNIDIALRQYEMLDAENARFMIHIDAKYNEKIPDRLIKENVKFAERRIDIKWGDITLVDAVMHTSSQAIKDFPDADYFILLSGNCFPVKTPNYINSYLSKLGGINLVYGAKIPSKTCRWLEGGRRRLECYSVRISSRDIATIEPRCLSWGNIRQFGKIIIGHNIKAFSDALRIFIFSEKRKKLDNMQCYGGELWWRLNRESLNKIVDYYFEHSEYRSYMNDTCIPDEIVFISLVNNLCDKIANSILTFINWKGQKSPDFIRMNDIELIDKYILDKDTLFIRKVKDLDVIQTISDKLKNIE